MIATIRLLDENYMGSFYFTREPAEQIKLAKDLMAKGVYRIEANIVADGFEGEKAAEEMFDLTNNPGRQEEREERYGRGRSVSVGDIVSSGGNSYLCMSRGWSQIS